MILISISIKKYMGNKTQGKFINFQSTFTNNIENINDNVLVGNGI